MEFVHSIIIEKYLILDPKMVIQTLLSSEISLPETPYKK